MSSLEVFKAENCAAGLEANQPQLADGWHLLEILLKNLQKLIICGPPRNSAAPLKRHGSRQSIPTKVVLTIPGNLDSSVERPPVHQQCNQLLASKLAKSMHVRQLLPRHDVSTGRERCLLRL